MSDSAQTFECSSKPLLRRYSLGVAAVCVGFWFFDFVMRGWFGGTPSLAVSLRHTFIIAICLVFVVGFLIKDSLQRVRIDEQGITVEDAGGRRASMTWSEIATVSLEPKRMVCRTHDGRALTIQRILANQQAFIESLKSLAGADHILVKAIITAPNHDA